MKKTIAINKFNDVFIPLKNNPTIIGNQFDSKILLELTIPNVIYYTFFPKNLSSDNYEENIIPIKFDVDNLNYDLKLTNLKNKLVVKNFMIPCKFLNIKSDNNFTALNILKTKEEAELLYIHEISKFTGNRRDKQLNDLKLKYGVK